MQTSVFNNSTFIKFLAKHHLAIKLGNTELQVFRGNCPICKVYPFHGRWEAIALFGGEAASARGDTMLEAIAPLVIIFEVYVKQLMEA